MKKLFIIILLLGLSGCSLPNLSFGGAEQDRLTKINVIVDMLSIGDIIKSIAYTDDNTGENFIIKTDNKDYYSFGGDVLVDFSITNVSVIDQNANIVFSLGKNQFISKVQKFIGNTEIVSYTKATATTTSEKIITKTPIWEDISFSNFKVSDSSLTRKDSKGRTIDKTFQDNFKSGETKYYQAIMRIPHGITEHEWFIEVFGINNYGHLDPNAWTYEQKFNDLNDGGINGQDSWTYNTGSDNAVVTTSGTPYEGTKHLNINSITKFEKHGK